MLQFELDISYGQIAVFDPTFEKPFNDWSSRHNSQGFSWRPGSVSFATTEYIGSIKISVIIQKNYHQINQAIRVIRVPFVVPDSGQVEVASITNSVIVAMAPGNYSLFFEQNEMISSVDMTANLVFVLGIQEPLVLVADEGLSPQYPLLMEAEPA